MPKISEYPSATTAGLTDVVAGVVSGATKKIPISILKAAILPVVPAEIVPQAVSAWQDTAATDPTATAAGYYIQTRRRNGVSTTTAAANQTLDSGSFAFGGVDITLPPNSVTTVEVSIDVKRPATADGGVIFLSGTFVRNGTNAPVRVGTDDQPTPKLTTGIAGMTANLFINGNGIDVRCSPGVAVATNYGVLRTQRVKTD